MNIRQIREAALAVVNGIDDSTIQLTSAGGTSITKYSDTETEYVTVTVALDGKPCEVCVTRVIRSVESDGDDSE